MADGKLPERELKRLSPSRPKVKDGNSILTSTMRRQDTASRVSKPRTRDRRARGMIPNENEVGGINHAISRLARKKLNSLLNDPHFNEADPETFKGAPEKAEVRAMMSERFKIIYKLLGK